MEFPTTTAVIPRQANNDFKTGSKAVNYIETWSDNSYTVRTKANVAQWFGVNALLFDGLFSEFYYTLQDTFVTSTPFAFKATASTFKGDAGATSIIDLGRAITPHRMALTGRTVTNAFHTQATVSRFKIYGSNTALDWDSTSSATWIQLFAQTSAATYPASRVYEFDIPATNAVYQYYAMVFTHSNGKDYIHMAEWDIFGTFSECGTCPTGEEAPVGATSASQCAPICPANAAPIPSTTTCQCNAGFSGPPDACLACPAGSYKALAGAGACDTCLAGQITLAAGSTSVADCIQVCAAPASTSLGTVNFARACGAGGGVGACAALQNNPRDDIQFGGAAVAVDGVKADSDDTAYIFHSDGTQTNEWWRVDFGVSRRSRALKFKIDKILTSIIESIQQ